MRIRLGMERIRHQALFATFGRLDFKAAFIAFVIAFDEFPAARHAFGGFRMDRFGPRGQIGKRKRHFDRDFTRMRIALFFHEP